MNALHPYVVRSMESPKRRNLEAMDRMLGEGLRDMRNKIESDMRRIRRNIESYRKAKASRELVRKQLREGDL